MRRPIAALTLLAALAGCTPPPALSAADGRVQVVTTTGILADLVRHVGGDRVLVDSIVPDNADAHAYEPTLRDVRNVVYADLAFSNYLLLEAQNVIKTLDANLPDGVEQISLAEGATKYAAEIIPLVEDVSLDTVWLGLRVAGDGAQLGADRTSDVRLSATGISGPGRLTAYLTESFGNPDVFIGSGESDDTAVLPPDAHMHMSWAFTEPGVYRLDLRAQLEVGRPVPMGEQTVTFAVGVDPHTVPGMAGATVLRNGHTDITADIDSGEIYLLSDDGRLDPARTVIEVPAKALREVPAGPGMRFLGRPGTRVYQLPQAVLGRHVHGEIDPHLWQDVGNAQAYAELIRDSLIEADPAGAAEYRANTDRYLRELTELDDYVRDRIAAIPEPSRYLVTTHDAFGYLAKAYKIVVAGFVTPNPAVEPSLADRRRLTETLRHLRVRAVFLEPNLRARSSTLVEVARQEHVRVCDIYGDAFDDRVTSYVAMMRFNADSLHRCLT
ncbi:anchored repeat ABC transporter, substrate-binding protein [Paractinoplanes atraurantiacus]|uniref:Anchored repeat ABC transporter, substrate-binding protein n=1 Tax=Paractinoplanes atraurantiacus TaxID=1036182 RepID=A0A285JMC4_9ACTN|nr:anchored repeat ABC transporter, substrate-binding protein [Actinoplanes atraurantiacus]SNY61462.1 anchored repeat ABC transporter, substrate-binding protein [Actinoplanes atraurantiacus]